MPGFTASWVHGNAVAPEQPSGLNISGFELRHVGWGTHITMLPNHSAWFHIAIPSPVIIDGHRMKLVRAFLQFSGVRQVISGGILDVHLWDAAIRIGTLSDGNFKRFAAPPLPGSETYELLGPRELQFGLGISFKIGVTRALSDNLSDPAQASEFLISSAGADFGP